MIENTVTRAVAHFNLTSPVAIAEKGGIIYGNIPKFDKTKGMYFDGSTNYIEYKIPNTLVSHREVSIVVEFWPDFDLYSGDLKVVFDSAPSTDFARVFFSGTGSLGTHYGGLYKIPVMPDSIVAPVFERNRRNLFVASYKDGDCNAYYNGVKLQSSTASISVIHLDRLHIGGQISRTTDRFFLGWIKGLTFYNTALTEQEAKDLYTQGTFSYRKEANIWLDMAAVFDGKVLDKSGHGNHFTISGNPKFLNPGLRFNGVSYLESNAIPEYEGRPDYSFVVCCRPNTSRSQHYLFGMGRTASNSQAVIYFPSNTQVGLSTYGLDLSVVPDLMGAQPLSVIVGCEDSSKKYLYVNGELLGTGVANTALNIQDSSFRVACGKNITGTYTNFFVGDIYHVSAYPKVLTPIQVRELTTKLLTKYGQF